MLFVKTCLRSYCVLLFCLCFVDSILDEATVYGNHSVLVVVSDVSISSSAITNRQRSCLMDSAECTDFFECLASLFRSETCHPAHEPLHASVHQASCLCCPISQHRSPMQHSASTSRRMFTAAHCSSMNSILPHHCLITLSMHSESSPTHLRPPILRTVDVSTAGRSLLQACAPAAALLVGHLLATHPYQAALHVFATWEHVLSIQHTWTAPLTHPCTIRMYKPSWTSARVPCAT